MAALAYSIQSPVRSCTIPSSKIQLCRSYGCFAIVPKPADEIGLLRGSKTKSDFVPKSSNLCPKSSNLCFGLNGSSMGFRKCSFSSCVKGGVGYFVRVTKDLIFMLVHSLCSCVKGIFMLVHSLCFCCVKGIFMLVHSLCSCVKGGVGYFVRLIFTLVHFFCVKDSDRDFVRDAKDVIFMGSVFAITCFVANMSASLAWQETVFFIGTFIAIYGRLVFEFFHKRQVSQPFSLGDTIKVGSMEGQVPNLLLSSQAILNLSRAGRRIVTTIRFHTDDLAKVPRICDDIMQMFNSNPMILEDEPQPPHCYLSSIEGSDFVLTLGCTLKEMSEGAFYSARQDILLLAVDLIKWHGAAITFVDFRF